MYNFRLHTNAIVNQKLTGLKVETGNDEKTMKKLEAYEAARSYKEPKKNHTST